MAHRCRRRGAWRAPVRRFRCGRLRRVRGDFRAPWVDEVAFGYRSIRTTAVDDRRRAFADGLLDHAFDRAWLSGVITGPIWSPCRGRSLSRDSGFVFEGLGEGLPASPTVMASDVARQRWPAHPKALSAMIRRPRRGRRQAARRRDSSPRPGTGRACRPRRLVDVLRGGARPTKLTARMTREIEDALTASRPPLTRLTTPGGSLSCREARRPFAS